MTGSQGKVQVPDVAAQVTYAMRQMGVSPIPRNYELFYEAYIGSNPKLTKDLAALGNRATQEELDVIGAQYFGRHQVNAVDHAHHKIVRELEGLVNMLRQEQSSLESYNKLLGETYQRINSKSAASTELLTNAISLLTEATDTTMSHGQETMVGMANKSREMEDIRRELDEYKRIANTDSLTRLYNRRAFDEKLASIFDSQFGRATTSLVIGDIDHFKNINDTFGHPVGDKILATVANVIRSNVRKDVFVARTGGEEFAIILEGASQEEASAVSERIRRALESTPFKNSKTGVNYGPVTLSLGLCLAAEAESPQELYQKADVALYCAKSNGRNKVMVFEDGMKKELSKSWLLYKK